MGADSPRHVFEIAVTPEYAGVIDRSGGSTDGGDRGVATLGASLEVGPHVVERALREREHFQGHDGEHEHAVVPLGMDEAAVLHAELPPPVPLSRPRRGQPSKRFVLGCADSVPLDDDVEAGFPAVRSRS